MANGLQQRGGGIRIRTKKQHFATGQHRSSSQQSQQQIQQGRIHGGKGSSRGANKSAVVNNTG
jgi:hypothetical protein